MEDLLSYVYKVPAFLFGILCWYVIYLLVIKPFLPSSNNWKKEWKSLSEYWEQHPDCKTENGTKCFNCGSSNIRQRGYEDSRDSKRVHFCNQCNTGLYRS